MIRTIAIDDEPLALQQLTSYIEKVPFLKLVAECRSAMEAMEVLNNEEVDAIFCDINMPDINGMELIKSLPAPPIVVFTTASADHALEGYKFDAADYLLKPFGLMDFKRAANKVQKRYYLANSKPAGNSEDDTVFLKTENRMVKVAFNDIRYIEGMSEYIKVYLEGQKPIVVLLALKRMEDRMPSYFMRIHRSYIINLKKIQEVNKNRVIMDQDTYLPIGENYKNALTEYISDRFLGK